MKNTYRFLILCLLAASIFTSCKKEQQQVQASVADVYDSPAPTKRQTPASRMHDTVKSGTHKYTYTIDRAPLDSVIVVDEEGYEFCDNSIKVQVSCDGTEYFSHTFRKISFTSFIDDRLRLHGILDGCRFIKMNATQAIFSMCVSLPDSDLSQPLLLTVERDGSYNIAIDTTPDMENLTDSISLADGV